MYATLTAAALTLAAAQQPPTGSPERLAQPGATAGGHSIDGNWTIVCLEKNGQPVADARNLTVSIRGDTITFTKAGGSPSEMRPMRIEFTQNGHIRVTEAAADNTFPPAGTAAQPAAGGQTGTKTGVYVLTQDYLAVCVHDQRPGTGTGTATATQPGGVQPAGGTADAANNQPGAGTAGQPQQRTYCTVILRRAEGRPVPGE